MQDNNGKAADSITGKPKTKKLQLLDLESESVWKSESEI